MDIRRHASCNPAALSMPVVMALLIVAMIGAIAGRDFSRLLANTGSPASRSPAYEAAHAAALSDATAQCRDPDPAYRTKYQMALDRFKAGEMGEAEIAFRELAGGENGPLIVRACSLNMLGQVARLGGERQKARDAFDRLSVLLEPVVVNESRSADPSLVRLFGTACIRTAEISEQTADPKAAIAEYERVLRASGSVPDNPWLNAQCPWIMDRLAQLRLSTRDLDGYLRCAERLRQKHPAYERAVLVGLEMECVRLLQQSGDPAVVPQNSYDAPAWAIAYVRSHDDASVRRRLLDIATSTCPALPRTCTELVACYHAAWMLETVGEVEEAARRFSQVASADLKTPERAFIAGRTIETIQGYARVQHAILLAETGRYDEALRTLAAVSTRQGGAHVATLTEATRKNIETLKREVFSNEK
jgi:tetratricopeptide (TPR) repeat protein